MGPAIDELNLRPSRPLVALAQNACVHRVVLEDEAAPSSVQLNEVVDTLHEVRRRDDLSARPRPMPPATREPPHALPAFRPACGFFSPAIRDAQGQPCACWGLEFLNRLCRGSKVPGMRTPNLLRNLSLFALAGLLGAPAGAQIVHDAEYYIVEAQNRQRWNAEDTALTQRLAELRAKHGTPPNLIHIMWDDTAYGDIGIPAIQKVRGFETPNLNKLAAEGMLFTRMYTECGCTPSRAACATGRLAVRVGMSNIGMLLESHGMAWRRGHARRGARQRRLCHRVPRQVAPGRHRGELSPQPGLRRGVLHRLQPDPVAVDRDR